ncbi:hypothetical protein KZ483_02820 [Paenibacillus sp. sptzw28]|uniref:hypothetical protein n=1 Tax=Paenibacillus sp. sptzw28 TaxID=715179 RepID=UPI001C6E3C69|nr:hypothetical protein [Paenibacillus sp. sptzw28]QYR21984.1 hypothetical protein KZ483_02820 [Paenibacillus sp. sptzw28]
MDEALSMGSSCNTELSGNETEELLVFPSSPYRICQSKGLLSAKTNKGKAVSKKQAAINENSILKVTLYLPKCVLEHFNTA